MNATQLFDRLVESAWTCGDPGLLFLDRLNLFNPTPELGEFVATNPCGEQPLLAYESCNLGSINLSKFVQGGKVLWDELRDCIGVAVRFLDNVIDLNSYPIESCKRLTLTNRKIGLGVMGLADLLLALRVPYDSSEAQVIGEKIMSFVDREAKAASAKLAVDRGAFRGFGKSLWGRLGYPRLRNATVSTVAPTGTISLIAGCSSGIEPIFSARLERHVLDGKVLREVHPALSDVLHEEGVASGWQESELREILGESWSPAHEVSVHGHLRMQAAFQRHSDSAVSKTINLPQSATEDDVRKAYLMAYRLGCKGITIYRDQSRPTQVLQKVRDESCEVCAD